MSIAVQEKKTILFLCPDAYRPDLPNFSRKYEELSRFYDVQVIVRTDVRYDKSRIGTAVLNVMPIEKKKHGLRAVFYAVALFLAGRRICREKKVDLIVGSDPLTLGVAASALKVFFKTRLVIEINGHLEKAAFLTTMSFWAKVKRGVHRLAMRMSIRHADAIKLLNPLQHEELRDMVRGKHIYIFHDHVPVEIFRNVRTHDNYIFFAGHPFYVKGVDILIQAFKKISRTFPHVKLLVMGHNNTDLSTYVDMANDCSQIVFLKPVYYDEIVPYFENCMFFVLPSRSEAMGRVLIEAMASGKAVIASRVDGIPYVVDDGKTGLLFHPGDAAQLSERMQLLLTRDDLRMHLGSNGYKKAHHLYSSGEYVARFRNMVQRTLACNCATESESNAQGSEFQA